MSVSTVRDARVEDVPRMARLLEESSLSPEGIAEFLEHFRVVCEGADIVGMVGLELYGQDGLLRSLAVAQSERSRGIGLVLLQRAIEDARRLGILRLVLLTTTAADYFARQGFRAIDRGSVTGGLTSSSQFRGACPATATCMELLL